MLYAVSGIVAGSPQPLEFHYVDHVSDALRQATALLANGATNVSIVDQRGHHIEGDALADCCRTGRIQANLKPW
jgi:hypothetical protein